MKKQVTEMQKKFILSKLEYTFNNELNIENLITKISKDINEIHLLTSNVENIIMINNSEKNKITQKSPDISKKSQLHPKKQLISLKSKDNIYSCKNIFENRLIQTKEKENKAINDQILNLSKTFYSKKILSDGHSADKIKTLNKRKSINKQKDKYTMIEKPLTSRENKGNINTNKIEKNKENPKDINKKDTEIKIKDMYRKKSVDDINNKILNKSTFSKDIKNKNKLKNNNVDTKIDTKIEKEISKEIYKKDVEIKIKDIYRKKSADDTNNKILNKSTISKEIKEQNKIKNNNANKENSKEVNRTDKEIKIKEMYRKKSVDDINNKFLNKSTISKEIKDKNQIKNNNADKNIDNKIEKNKENSKDINKNAAEIKIKDMYRKKSVDDINNKILNKSTISKEIKDQNKLKNNNLDKNIDNKIEKNKENSKDINKKDTEIKIKDMYRKKSVDDINNKILNKSTFSKDIKNKNKLKNNNVDTKIDTKIEKEISKEIYKKDVEIKIKDIYRKKSADDTNNKILNKSTISKEIKDQNKIKNNNSNKNNDVKIEKNSNKNSVLNIKKSSNIIKEKKTEKNINNKKTTFNRSNTSENILAEKIKNKNKGKNVNLNQKNIKNKKSTESTDNSINIKESNNSKINKKIIIKSVNSKTFPSSNYLECLYLSLNSGFFIPNQKLKIFINSKQLYNFLDKEKIIKDLINYYSSKNISIETDNKYDMQKINEKFKPTKIALNSLNFLDNVEQEKLLNEPQNPIVIDFFRIILILLNEYNENILKESDKNILEHLFKDLFIKYNVKTAKELMVITFVDKIPKIDDGQFDLVQKILSENNNVFSPATLLKYNRSVSYFAFFMKELYSYLTLKNEDGTYYYQIRERESQNKYEDKIDSLRKYLIK